MRLKNKFFYFVLSLLLLGTAVPSQVSASPVDLVQASEEVGFKICYLRIYHQETWRTLSFKIWYDGKEASEIPNTVMVKESVHQFLSDYENPIDYWEIMNTNLVHYLKEKYPSITDLEIEISVIPDALIPYNRRSIVACKEGCFKEGFGFKLEMQNTILDVAYTYSDTIQIADYPDFRWIGAAIEDYLDKQWDAMRRDSLTKHLLRQFPMLKSIKIIATEK